MRKDNPLNGPGGYREDLLQAKIFEQLNKGKPLVQICKDGFMWKGKHFGFPRYATVRAFLSRPGWEEIARLDKLNMESFTWEMVHESKDIADEVDASQPGEVAKAKLRIDTRLKAAALFNPNDFGSRVNHALQIDVGNTLGEILRKSQNRLENHRAEKMIEGEILPHQSLIPCSLTTDTNQPACQEVRAEPLDP